MGDGMHRIFGGSPAKVLLRLVVLSFVVGVVLSALGIEPFDIVRSAARFIHDLWAMGFDAVDRIGRYFLLGAVVVVPIWILSRLLKSGR